MHLSCFEWETIKAESLRPNIKLFHDVAKREAVKLKLPQDSVLTRTSEGGLKAGQVVGVLTIGGHTLEILPKIDNVAGEKQARLSLIHMLRIARSIPITHGDVSHLEKQRYGLLEYLIRLFTKQLIDTVRLGLPRRYISLNDELGYLRGKLNIKDQFTRLAVRPDLLACTFEELSVDTPLNRVMKAAVLLLCKITNLHSNSLLLTELLAHFKNVSTVAKPLSELVQFDRTNENYHRLYRFASLFLSGYWQSTTRGKDVGYSLLFPMDQLFEEFIGRKLKRTLAPSYVVKLQHLKHYVFENENKKGIFKLKPDVVITNPDRSETIVLDTKWKKLHESLKNYDVQESDIYQMLTYQRAYKASRLILLYPSSKHCSKLRVGTWKVKGTNCTMEIATVDISNISQIDTNLRNIVVKNPHE